MSTTRITSGGGPLTFLVVFAIAFVLGYTVGKYRVKIQVPQLEVDQTAGMNLHR